MKERDGSMDKRFDYGAAEFSYGSEQDTMAAAKTLWSLYNSFIKVGFDKDQAYEMTKLIFETNIKRDQRG